MGSKENRMSEGIIIQLCQECFSKNPLSVTRCGIGTGNYVFAVAYDDTKYTIRCSEMKNAYVDTMYWLKRLASLDIPVPKIIANGAFREYEYLILSYIEGEDLGVVYPDLSTSEKKQIAKNVIEIQNRVATLELDALEADWEWGSFIQEMLDRAKERILDNGYFDAAKVERLRLQMDGLCDYFASIKPVAYLDDITTKNLLIYHGQVSGIIDIDWIGIGDRLTFAALTKMALLNQECDTDYVSFILNELQLNRAEKKAFDFYVLMYCVDFMGERGTQFLDKTVEVNSRIVDRLNQIYDTLWNEYIRE